MLIFNTKVEEFSQSPPHLQATILNTFWVKKKMQFQFNLTLFNYRYCYLTHTFHIHREKLLHLKTKRSWRKATEEIEKTTATARPKYRKQQRADRRVCPYNNAEQQHQP